MSTERRDGSGLEWRRFLFYNATGAIVWSTAVATAGYLLAYSWETLERWIGLSGVIILAVVVVIVAAVAWRQRRTASVSE